VDVLHITEACGAGVRRHLGLILPALRARGIECGLFAFGSRFEQGFVEEFSELECFQCQVDASPRPFSLLKAVSHIRRLCREWKPRVIHCHAFAAGVAGRLAAPPGVKTLYSPHAFNVNRFVPFPRRLVASIAERALRGRTDGFVLVGPGELEDAKALGIPEDRIHQAFNGLSESISDEFLPREAARAELGLSNDEKAVIAPCRLEPQKGLGQLLLVWRGLPGVRLHVFGDGTMKGELESMIVDCSLEGQVVLHGVQPNLHRYLRAFDAGILPSLYEGLSYSLLEMLAAGIPVAASDIPANRVADNLRLFPLDDSNAMLAAIQKAIADFPNAPFFPFTLDRQVEALANSYFASHSLSKTLT